MHRERTAARDGIVVAHGYGLKIHVQRGHLVVHDGIGDQRQTCRYNRATGRLKRVVVIGHTGYVTLEALRWITDVGAVFAQIGRDGELIATSAPARHHESKLRRAQVLAAENEQGRTATVALLKAKLNAQAALAERLAHLKATVRVKDAHPITVADAIRGWAGALNPTLSFARMREIESSAGRAYWQTWARLSPRFHSSWTRTIPEHWRTAGPRTSYVDRKRARKATTPVHALLNYTYAILEVEATIAAHAIGFDPSLGIMHVDQRYRGSLATDLMEPARPAADALVLDLIDAHEFRRGDLHENREGVCRVGLPLARELAQSSPRLRAAVAPHAESLARQLLRKPDHATPLTRARHRRALAPA
jgi:CRISPR-associated protein Cas1